VLVTNEYKGQATGEAVSGTEDQRAAAVELLDKEQRKAMNALQILKKRDTGSKRSQQETYAEALASLSEAEQETWEREIERRSDPIHYMSLLKEAPNCETPSSLEDFIKSSVLPRYRDRRLELENRELIREQSFGEAVNAPELDGYARYEVHLDRKFERTLALLVKLKALRQTIDGQ
jgi:hypothetical protein